MSGDAAYRQTFKAIGLFGGVQVIKIIIGIVQTKVIAIYIGAVGVGIQSLFNTTLGMITSVFGFGLGSSAVRDISEVIGENNTSGLYRVIHSLKFWLILGGMTGAFFTIVFSKQLSLWTFDSDEYKWAFVVLSVFVFFTIQTSGLLAIIQGTRQLTNLAKAGIAGSLCSLFISVPLYYWKGVEGIVPVFFMTSIITWGFALYLSRKVTVAKNELTIKELWKTGGRMVKLGIALTANSFIAILVSYVVNIYINRTGGVAQVGFYQAGYIITTQYVGLIFTAMTADYYPRLAAINKFNDQIKKCVNQQAEIAVLILTPLLILLLTFAPIVINILYTKEFYCVIEYISLAILAMLFRAASWCMAYIILAKGKTFLFLSIETFANLLLLGGNLIGYKNWGLTGLGLSYLGMYLVYFILHLIINNRLFHFSFHTAFVRLFVVCNIACFVVFLLYKVNGYPWLYLEGSLIFICIALFSMYELNKRIDFKEKFIQLLHKHKNR